MVLVAGGRPTPHDDEDALECSGDAPAPFIQHEAGRWLGHGGLAVARVLLEIICGYSTSTKMTNTMIPQWRDMVMGKGTEEGAMNGVEANFPSRTRDLQTRGLLAGGVSETRGKLNRRGRGAPKREWRLGRARDGALMGEADCRGGRGGGRAWGRRGASEIGAERGTLPRLSWSEGAARLLRGRGRLPREIAAREGALAEAEAW
jgi:hypothetical protein|uniref:Uncharacterized protein n=2 Tax=Zea mays TaxID=4577 RepID=A0A804P9Q1_MAIZE